MSVTYVCQIIVDPEKRVAMPTKKLLVKFDVPDEEERRNNKQFK